MFKWILGRKQEDIYYCKAHDKVNCISCPITKQELIGWTDNNE